MARRYILRRLCSHKGNQRNASTEVGSIDSDLAPKFTPNERPR